MRRLPRTATSPQYNSCVARTYVQVVLVEIAVIVALWAIGRAFA